MPRKQRTWVRRHGNKEEVTVRVKGHLYRKAFDLGTPETTMAKWREDEREKHEGHVAAEASIAAAIPIYIGKKKTMNTIKQREAHLWLWADALGRDRSPFTVTPDEVERIVLDWIDDGLAPGTVKKRRTALQSFYVKLNGKKGFNPVKGTLIPKTPRAEARHLDRLLVEKAIAQMPTYRSTKKGAPKELNLAKIRARVIASTGIPPIILMDIKPHDLVLRHPATVHVVPRIKGEGVEARTLSLVDEALAAFKDFHAADAYGPFAVGSANRAFKRGAKKAGLDPNTVHLYDLRHSFLTDLYRVCRDLATVGRLGLHAEGSKVTERYARGANDEVDVAATEKLSQAWAKKRQDSFKVVGPARATAKKVKRG